MKAYIAGKITGDENYRRKFQTAREKLEEHGFTVINPAELPEGMRPEDYMRICLAMMDSADIVAFLPDYDQSRGGSAGVGVVSVCKQADNVSGEHDALSQPTLSANDLHALSAAHRARKPMTLTRTLRDVTATVRTLPASEAWGGQGLLEKIPRRR